MIRINLLGTAKPKKGRRGRRFAMPTLTTDGPSPLIAGLALVVLCGAGLFLYHSKLTRTHDRLQQQIKKADQDIKAMRPVKAAYEQRQKDYDAFKRRFDIIDQLRASQVGPVPLLETVSDTVNNSDGVWLLTMRDQGAKVVLEGVAVGPVQVAKLMTNLKKTEYFKTVELSNTSQRNDAGIETFSFKLVCEKTNTKA